MDEYLTDLIDIITYTYDEDGVKTATSTQSDVKARIEDKNQVVRNLQGQEVSSNTFLMVDESATLTYDSLIVLKSQNGVAMPQPSRELAILRLGKGHGFDVEYWRVWL